jgi:hypothetical protein
MSVSYEFEHEVQTVYEALTEPQFLVDRCSALGELSAECDVEEAEDGTTTINLLREIERDLPKILAKVFDPVQVMDMTEEWRPDGDGWRGDWHMDVRGQPVVISASFELVPTAQGCQYTVTHSAKAKVPLIGKQLQKYILGQTSDGANDELAYLAEYLG